MLQKALEYLAKILKGDKEHKSDLMKALHYQLEAQDGVTNECEDKTKCTELSDLLAWSMDGIMAAMKLALPDNRGDIEDQYNLVFGKNGASSGDYAEDMYTVGKDVLDMLEEKQS
ncbi:hypothetical protein Q1695_004318 [Nippostrongylus brasiliensis]|nr:hypothetical protein Q1695_004318 [Nippostrongylus brasiliensis]